MPSELILPALAITLLANAVLIVLAIRMFITERPDSRRDAESPTSSKPVPTTPGSHIGGVDEGADLHDQRPLATTVSPAPGVEPTVMKPEPTSAMANNRTTVVSKPANRSRRRHRARFSIPALEEDHDRFNQSIADLLSGGSRKPRDPE